MKFTTANFEAEVLQSDIPVLVDFYAENKWEGRKLSRNERYKVLQEFAVMLFREKESEEKQAVFEQILFYDYCLREKPKARPDFGKHSLLDKQILKENLP